MVAVSVGRGSNVKVGVGPGSTIICIDSTTTPLRPNRPYRVLKVGKGIIDTLEVSEIYNNDPIGSFFARRFRLALWEEIEEFASSCREPEATDLYDETPEIAEIRRSFNARS
jgi:hypothetical protein